MHWPSAGLLEEFAEEVAIEPGENEPLCAPRRAGDDVDILGTQALLADEMVGVWAGEEREHLHPLMLAPMPSASETCS